MKNKLSSLFLFFIIAAALSFGLLFINQKATPLEPSTSTKAKILVSILPQKQIVEQIAGDDFEVIALIPPGFSPETYDPTPTDVKNISEAEIYFRIGHISFEKTQLENFKNINPKIDIVDTSVLNDLRMIEAHSHDDEGADGIDQSVEESGIDPHVWLAPLMVKQQAEVVRDTLIAHYPSQQLVYEQKFDQLASKLDALDADLTASFAPLKDKTMLVYHPAFGYLADAYGFHQEHIQIEGKDPSITELKAIIDEARVDGVKVIFVQKQFNQDSALALADNIGGVVVQIDPLDPDYINNMSKMGRVISENLQK